MLTKYTSNINTELVAIYCNKYKTFSNTNAIEIKSKFGTCLTLCDAFSSLQLLNFTIT